MTFFQKKTFRYYQWLLRDFIFKYSKIIFLSAFISTIVIVSAITVSPQVIQILSSRNIIIGYDSPVTVETLPEEITNKISNGLLFVNNQGEIYPLLASSWEKLNNGLTYRFHIKKDVLWNDGKLFTVKDINYNFKDVSIKRIGDFTIEYTLQKPFSNFPLYLTKPIIKYPYIGVGGLYSIEKIKQKQGKISEMRIIPNKKDLQPILYRFFDNESQMVSSYKLGRIHEMTVNKKTIADVFLSWKNTEVIKKTDYSRLFTLFFNYKNPLFKERELRSGIASAINGSKLESLGITAETSIPPLSWAHNTQIQQTTFDFDLAQKIIYKYKSASESAKINISTYYEYLDIADQINNDLKAAGLSTNLNVISYSDASDFDILLTYMTIPIDPDQYFYWHSSQSLANKLQFKNLKIDKLLEDGRSITAIEERKRIYFDFQKTMNEDVSAIFLFYPYIYTVKRI